jgi:hypothetical protein
MAEAENLIEYFRTRHGWKCRRGSAIVSDLTAFAVEQAGTPRSDEDLYVLFCLAHGMRPKPLILKKSQK